MPETSVGRLTNGPRGALVTAEALIASRFAARFIDVTGQTRALANVMPDDVMETEALRCGLSVVGPEVADKAAD